jgi:hypothetical protein
VGGILVTQGAAFFHGGSVAETVRAGIGTTNNYLTAEIPHSPATLAD